MTRDTHSQQHLNRRRRRHRRQPRFTWPLGLVEKLTVIVTICIVGLIAGLVWRKHNQNQAALYWSQQTLPVILKPNLIDDKAPLQVTYEQMFKTAADRFGLEWRILAEQAHAESRFDPLAIGLLGEMGLMQVQPATWQAWAPKVGVTDPFDAYSSTLVAAAYLDHWGRYFAELGHPEPYWPLIAYNWGPANLYQFLDEGGQWAEVPASTRNYSLTIIRSAKAETIRPVLRNHLRAKIEIVNLKQK